MPRLSNEEIATVLAGIANEVERYRRCAPEDLNLIRLTFGVSELITDFFEDQSDRLCELYDSKLNFIER